VASSANTRSSTVQGSVAGCGRAAARPGPAATRKRTAASAQAAPGLAARLIAPSGLHLPVDDLHAVGIVGLEDEAAVAVLAQPAGDVLVAEEQLLVGLLGRGDEEGERHLVLRPLVVEVLVDDPRARRRRPAQHLDRRRAGLVERAAGVLAVPALQPGQRQHFAVEAAGALEALGPDHHPKLSDLHSLSPLLPTTPVPEKDTSSILGAPVSKRRVTTVVA